MVAKRPVAAYWLSCRRFTVLVEVNRDGAIHRTAPIVRRFRGQQLPDLLNWAGKWPPVFLKRLAG